MQYLIYLAVLGFFLFMGAVSTITIVPALAIRINFSNLINFLDIQGIVFVLLLVILVLVFTKSLIPMKDAFLFVLGKRDAAVIRHEECILAVKTTMMSAVSAGTLMFLMSVVNMLKSMDLDAGSSRLGLHLSIGLLSLIYGGIVVLIVLPLYVSLKRSLVQKQEMKKHQPVSIQSKKKTARGNQCH